MNRSRAKPKSLWIFIGSDWDLENRYEKNR